MLYRIKQILPILLFFLSTLSFPTTKATRLSFPNYSSNLIIHFLFQKKIPFKLSLFLKFLKKF
jgi:hypothetical protein